MTEPSSQPVLVELGDAHDRRRCGGKAAGLAALIAARLNVPEGFVLPRPAHPSAVAAVRQRVGAASRVPWAVRSSAVDEDGTGASFAGQFVTMLDRVGTESILQAVVDCAASGQQQRVGAYAAAHHPSADLRVAVVVQRQIDAAWAGVLFTAEPSSGRRDRMVLSATPGLGEALVAGQVDGAHFVLAPGGELLDAPADDPAVAALSPHLPAMAEEARRAAAHLGRPLDLEWAIDHQGRLFWLQARPITTLPGVHPNELDDPWPPADALFTRGNIGEMMPGPVTPLTGSVFGRAVDVGLQDFFVTVGAQAGIRKDNVYIKSFYNHLFFDVDALYDIARHVGMATKVDLELSIIGHPLPGELDRLAPRWRRAVNALRQIGYLLGAPARQRALEELTARFAFPAALVGHLDDLLDWIDRGREVLNQAYAHHYATSSLSGMFHATLMRILAGGSRERTTAHHRDAAALLQGIHGVDSAGVARGIEELAAELGACADRDRVTAMGPSKATVWLRGQAPPSLRHGFESFLAAHGHRAVREAELRTRDWSEAPDALTAILQSQARAARGAPPRTPPELPAELRRVSRGLSLAGRGALRYVVPRARQAVARRERTKSLCIRIQRELKAGYLALARCLTERGWLPDVDAVFFLQHQELASLVTTGDGRWADCATARRRLMPLLESLDFEDVCRGLPRPREPDAIRPPGAGLEGLPVSRGVVTGRARVIVSHEQAAELQPGEIMVARMTDVGWTPYFNVIAGLVTEIGSPLSHGAVVAREYGLPALVGVKGACAALAHGPEIVLDAERGVVTLADTPG